MGQRRKHVLQTAFNQDIQPPSSNQQIVRAVGARGGNIIEVQYPNGNTTLCMMPAKFNRKLWVRRGGFVIIEASLEAEEDANSRVTGTISAVLYEEHIKQLKKMPGVWPPEFDNTIQSSSAAAAALAAMDLMPPSGSSESEEDEPDNTDDTQTVVTANAEGSLQGQCNYMQQQQQQQLQQQQKQRQQPQQQKQQQEQQGMRASLCAAGATEAGGATDGMGNSTQGQGSCQHGDHATDGDSSEEDDGLPPLQQINNRRVVHYDLSDDSESTDDA